MVVRAGQGFHGTANQSSAFLIKKSLKFKYGTNQVLTFTPSSVGNRKQGSASFWLKWGRPQTNGPAIFFAGTSSSPSFFASLEGIAADTLNQIRAYSTNITAGSNQFGTSTLYPYYRDFSAWYHILWVWDSDNTSLNGNNRTIVYANGVQIAGDNVGSNVGGDTQLFNTVTHYIGGNAYVPTGDSNADYYIAEFHAIDGQVLTPSDFGFTDPLTNTWRPKKYTGTYGTNGFYLDFSDSSNLGADRSGNGNNFTASGFVADDLVLDSPSGVTFTTAPTSGITTNNSGPSNYCTLNPLYYTASGIVQSDGHLKVVFPSAPPNGQRGGTLATTNAFYAEASPTALSGGSVYAAFGVIPPYRANSTTSEAGSFSDGWSYAHNGQIRNNNSAVTTVATYTVNDLIGVACDPSKGTIEFFKNGTSVYSGTGVPNVPMTISVAQVGGSGASGTWVINCGQKDFSYTPPSGFLPICTANLPTPTSPAAVRPDKYFNTVLYTGDDNDGRTVTGVGFQPDFVWIKSRNNALSHSLYDSVRGVKKRLLTNFTAAESDRVSSGDGVASFDADGFSLGAGGNENTNTYTHVAWCWKSGGAAVSNTDGSITSQVSANQDAGFSVITYSGTDTGSSQTIGHGLGAAPKIWIFKNRSASSDWIVYTTAIDGSSDFAKLNATDAFATGVSPWTTAPTSSVITVGTNNVDTCKAGNDYVLYAWAEIEGYSKFGSYTGNGNADGPFIHCGFKPAWIMYKITNTTGNWIIHDTTRSEYNVTTNRLFANLANTENTSTTVSWDILSNGAKIRTTDAGVNGSGNTFIFAAFAEAPTNNLYGGQANAR